MSGGLARLLPEEVKNGLADGTLLLIDVREPLEFVEARIPGALLFPLSTFDVAHLPAASNKRLVFSCRSGHRSQTAFARASAAGLEPHGHLEGGLKAWIAAGYEIACTDPQSGHMTLSRG